jgi:hypothetical protein
MQAVPVNVNQVAIPANILPVKPIIGCKLDVWNERATRTSGGLTKANLKLNRNGIVVSRKASAAAAKSKNLGKFQFAVKAE